MRSLLFSLAALPALCVLLLPVPLAWSDDDPAVELELTYPAGRSKKIFTNGWVFGARCIVGKGTPEEKDLSKDVRWSGTGAFVPAKGAESRPVFEKDGVPRVGENKIVLTVTVGGKDVTKSWTVHAVDPLGKPRYAKVGDIAFCPADAHGCMACPHPVTGPIIAGSPTVTIEGLPAARVGDPGIHAACCGPNTYKIKTGDPSVLIDGKPAARWGDETEHCGGMGTIKGKPVAYYAVFASTMPEFKDGAKPELGDKKPEDLKELLSKMKADDFTFPEPKPDGDLMVLRIEGAALEKYRMLIPGEKYALMLEGKIKHEEKLVPIEGAILLVMKSMYYELDDLKKHEKRIKADKLEKMGVLSELDGTGTIEEKGQTMTFGPLTKGWTEESKEQAVKMLVSIMAIFDCFIADAVYADRDAPEVNDFRRFRERVLRTCPEGRHLIGLYEEYGPGYAMDVRRDPVLKPLARFCLDRLAGWVAGLDLDDPATVQGLHAAVRVADAVASRYFPAGESRGVGRLIRVLVSFGLRR